MFLSAVFNRTLSYLDWKKNTKIDTPISRNIELQIINQYWRDLQGRVQGRFEFARHFFF